MARLKRRDVYPAAVLCYTGRENTLEEALILNQSVLVSALEKEGDMHRWSAALEGVPVGHAAACVDGPSLLIRELCAKEPQKGKDVVRALLDRAVAELGGGLRQAVLLYSREGEAAAPAMPLTGAASSLGIEAVIFDMDGLLFDTEALYIEAWPEVGKIMGLPISKEVTLATVGLGNQAHEQVFQEHYGPAFTMDTALPLMEEWMRDYVEEHGLPVKPGARALLNILREKGIPIAIGSSNLRYVVEAFLEQAELQHAFDILVAGDMVEKTKPAPDIFLRAAKELGVSPAKCLVLEDSPTGVEAAWRAGCIPAIVPDQLRPDDVAYGRVWRAFSSLEQLPLALF